MGTGGSGPPSTLTLSLLVGQRGGPGFVDGTGAAARFYALDGVASDGAGNIFVVDGWSLRKVVVATGVVTTLAGSPDITPFSEISGVASDGAGNLFVVDYEAIKRVVIATGAVTTFAGSVGSYGYKDDVGVAARFAGPSGVASDGAGNLFVTDSNMIRKVVIATAAVSTLAGSAGSTGQGSADGVGHGAAFHFPYGLVSDGAGNLFVADAGNNTIRKVVIASGVVTTLAGSPGITGSSDGTGSAASFNNPVYVDIDDSGNLYVVDRGNCALRKIALASAAVTTLAGAGSCTGASADGTGAAAALAEPLGVAYDGAGNLLVNEPNRIRKVELATGAVTTLAGAYGLGNADGTGPAARFNNPIGMAHDGAGNFYVADQGNQTLRTVVLATGVVTTLAGSPGPGASADGTGSAARFVSPWGLTTDGAGNLLVADEGDWDIRKVVLATADVTTLAGSGSHPSSDLSRGADGIGTAAHFDSPSGAASDGAGNLYVTDTNDMTIRKVVVATGAVTTLAGSVGASGSVDGIGATARFSSPWGIASDGSGNLFVADSTTIRKVVIATGAVSTLAGSSGSAGWTDATGSAARFGSLRDLAVDRAGNLLIVDSGNQTIRKLAIATGVVTTLVGAPGAVIALGPLPAGLADPKGIAVGPAGEILISDESAILVVR